MKKRVLILAATVLLLTLLLAIPASASRSLEVQGTNMQWGGTVPIEDTRGNRCHVTATNYITWFEGIQGESIEEARHLAYGPCMGGPGFWEETVHWEEFFTGTVLDSEPGTIRMTCPGKMVLNPPRWEGRCTLHSGTGGLANLHGTIQWRWPLEGTPEYQGQVHFDPK